MVVELLNESNVHEASIAALKYQSDLEHYFELNSAMLYENDMEKIKMRQAQDPVSTFVQPFFKLF